MVITEFGKRVLTSAGIVVVFLILFLLRAFVVNFGIYAFDAAFLALACLCTWEICNTKKLYNRGANAYIAFVVYGLIYMFFVIGSEILSQKLPWWLQLILSLLIVAIFSLFIGLSNMMDKKMAKECRLEKKDFNKECWGGALDLLQMIVYPGALFATLIILNHMVDNHLGLFGLLLVVFISCFADVSAYLVGMVLGKGARKMAPKISPKKTWVGFVGGLFGGILGALVVVWIISADTTAETYVIDKTQDATVAQLLFAVVGLVGAILTAVGDLYASFIKRKYDVKDFGHILPGHGGFMDRLDGIIFNAPFILLIMGII